MNDIEKDMNIKFKGYLKNVINLNQQYARNHIIKYDQQYNKKIKDVQYKINDQ
jgi:hypothetical protein